MAKTFDDILTNYTNNELMLQKKVKTLIKQ